jgi:hypothetical protein
MKTIDTNELRKAIGKLPTALGLINKSDVMAVITALEITESVKADIENENREGE